eukprot:CAMPEP_0175847492 /NCGR_PEP_ID=MMETSP0107_2-20121207/23382_1 /TAXON_ID=195067 ORGANISM="Goniomonas pacifica, Strain CCMP1869" /NCGR_SAMPLE_ID=MMETSP0107_2 /ASSEMBLY_ACC=CAM_ASM_000203 /LENGTH=61 /DNA_ID=CAMNT_0017162311 /DNA_START=240 /DNA_END=425 /DNA_ORIENTATION=+
MWSARLTSSRFSHLEAPSVSMHGTRPLGVEEYSSGLAATTALCGGRRAAESLPSLEVQRML